MAKARVLPIGISGSACAVEATVEIDRVEVPALAPGVTLEGENVQEVSAGNPLQASSTALENDPPTGVTVRW